jgi:hypothetical protein
MGEDTHEVAAVLSWRADGTAVLRHLAYGTEDACHDIARRASLGTTDWPVVAVRARGSEEPCAWWVRGQRHDQPPRPEGRNRR